MTRRLRWPTSIGRYCMALALGAATIAATVDMAAASPGTHARAATGAKRCAQRNHASGTFKFSDWEFPDTMNPFQSSQAVTFSVLNASQETLFLYNNQTQVKPQMLTTVPTARNGGITNSGKTITLHLKQGLRWSNGAALTAQDIKFSWQVSSDASTGPACLGNCDNIARMDTHGKYEIVAHMKSVYAAAIPIAFGFVILPHTWPGAWNDVHTAAEKVARDSKYNFEDTSYPSNGAYQVTQFVTNDRINLAPMKYYTTMNCGGYFKSLIFAFYSSKPGLIAAAAAGQTDLTGFGGGYTAADLPQLKGHAKIYRLNNQPSFNYEFLEMNHDPTYNGSPNPISNANVRVALALALDKYGLIRSALGVDLKTAKSIVAWTPWVNTPALVQAFANRKVTGQYDPLSKKYEVPGAGRALADARKLLAKTPFKSGFSVDFYTTSGNPVRQAEESVVAASWARIGVTVTPNFVPSTKLFGDWEHGGILQHGAFQIALHGFVGGPEPDTFKSLFQTRYIDRRQATHTITNQNTVAVSDPVLDRDFNIAGHTFDPRVRTANYNAIQEQINKQAHWIMFYFRPSIATAVPKLKGFSNNPTNLGPTWNIFNYKF